MRREFLSALLLAMIASAASAQTSTTNCNSYIPNNVQCTTTTSPSSGVNWGAFMQQQQQIQQQQNQQMQQSMQNLGAAIAAQRERKRQEKLTAALEAAVASDPDVPQPHLLMRSRLG
jgi:Spy/CpxP family protein refolding chaperone